MEIEWVYSAVRKESLNTIQVNYMLKWSNLLLSSAYVKKIPGLNRIDSRTQRLLLQGDSKSDNAFIQHIIFRAYSNSGRFILASV